MSSSNLVDISSMLTDRVWEGSFIGVSSHGELNPSSIRYGTTISALDWTHHVNY